MIRNESGKLVIESALLYPIVLMLTVGALVAAFAAGVHSRLYASADEAASRAAFVWDNSYRNPTTGDFYPSQYDDLYWRLTSDYRHSALAEKKLQQTLALYRDIPGKRGDYNNQVWKRDVQVVMDSTASVPIWLRPDGGEKKLTSLVNATVIEPAEWVRNIDMILLYWPLVRDTISPEQGESIVEEFRRRPGTVTELLTFNSHDEARSYLQHLVGGRLDKRDTEETGKWRMIDALDASGIAHQCYYGLKTNTQEMRDQMNKDAELLRRGELSGVTWHFFRRSKDGSIGLSDSLRRLAEERGIVIVIHE